MEDELAIEHHEDEAKEGDERTDDLTAIHALVLIAEGEQEGRDKGRGAHEDGDIGGRGVAQGHVFHEKIERTACHTADGKKHLMSPGAGPEATVREHDETKVGYRETIEEYVGGHKALHE